MIARKINNRPRFGPAHPVAAGIVFALTAGAAYFALRAAAGWDDAPRYLLEMFPPRHAWAYRAVFAVFLVWMGFAPLAAAGLITVRGSMVWLIPLFAVMVGLGGWVLLRFAVTMQTLWGLLGWPDLGWWADWQLMGRFVSLQAAMTIPLISAAVVVGGLLGMGVAGGRRRAVTALLWGAGWTAAAWLGSSEWLAENVLDELLRPGMAHMAAGAVLAWSAVAGLLVWPVRRTLDRDGAQKTPPADAEKHIPPSTAEVRRLGLMMESATIVYVGMLFYGSLMPFYFQQMSLQAAWREFSQTRMILVAVWRQSDVVANILMMVPTTFLALGAWTREGRRGGLWYKVPAVFVASVAISASLEFSQVFTINRVSSIHDIIAQAIGAGIGILGWVLGGAALCRWLRGFGARVGRAEMTRRLLWAYVVALAIYELMPFIPTISVGRIMRRYHRGFITLAPFADATAMELHMVVFKAMLYAPVGFLSALVGKGWGWRIVRGLLYGLALGLCLEGMQVFIISRFASATDVVLAAAGALGGAAVGVIVAAGATSPDRSIWWRQWGWAVKLPATVGWLVVLAWRRWHPFELNWPDGPAQWSALADRAAAVFTVPVMDIARTAGPLDAAARLAGEFASLLVLGVLLQSLLAHDAGWKRRVAVCVVTALLGVLLDAGRLVFLHVHRPDSTVLLAGLVGSVASVWAHRWAIHLARGKRDFETERPG